MRSADRTAGTHDSRQRELREHRGKNAHARASVSAQGRKDGRTRRWLRPPRERRRRTSRLFRGTRASSPGRAAAAASRWSAELSASPNSTADCRKGSTEKWTSILELVPRAGFALRRTNPGTLEEDERQAGGDRQHGEQNNDHPWVPTIGMWHWKERGQPPSPGAHGNRPDGTNGIEGVQVRLAENL